MMKNYLRLTTAITGTLGFAMLASVQAADIDVTRLPAISDVNGKVEIYGGDYSLNSLGSSTAFRGGASLSIPVTDLFGIQADVAASNMFGKSISGGTLHAFTRDPNSYLLGLTGGAGWSNNANFQYIGPEAELYMGNVSFQAYGGYLNLNGPINTTANFFGFADLSYYATPDFMLKIGVNSVANFKSAHAGVEWQVSDQTPLSFVLDGRVGDNGFLGASAGLKLYFGGSQKSLQRRHREDDPPNRSLDIFSGSGNALTPTDCPTGEIVVNGACKSSSPK